MRKKSRFNGHGFRNGIEFLDQSSVDGFGRAFHSHVEELSYELLKDAEYQKWMKEWAEGFLTAVLRKRRSAKTVAGR